MLFEKKMDPHCAYCQRCNLLDDTTAMCVKKGIVSLGDHCRHFRYDPLKRVPARPATPDFSKLKNEDFRL